MSFPRDNARPLRQKDKPFTSATIIRMVRLPRGTMHTPMRTLRCVIIMLALCIPHSTTAEETVDADLAEASKLVASLFRSPAYSAESILSPEQLNTAQEFITGGNPAIAEILWPKLTPPQSPQERFLARGNRYCRSTPRIPHAPLAGSKPNGAIAASTPRRC